MEFNRTCEPTGLRMPFASFSAIMDVWPFADAACRQLGVCYEEHENRRQRDFMQV